MCDEQDYHTYTHHICTFSQTLFDHIILDTCYHHGYYRLLLTVGFDQIYFIMQNLMQCGYKNIKISITIKQVPINMLN